jgi:hypothetical protein
LVELEQNLERIRKRGLGVAAISYDPVPVLKSFADTRRITFPLLSDPESKTIRDFGIFKESEKPGTLAYGVPYPGTYILDAAGVVVSKYFEPDYRERVTASDILVRQFGQEAEAGPGEVRARHARITASASAMVAQPGQKIALTLDVELGARMHVYAPGVEGYIPVEWKLDETPAAKIHPVAYPAARTLHLKVIKETVPVYEKRARLTREVTFGQETAIHPLLDSLSAFVLKGSFRYQACDDRECYPPETVPLEWVFHYQPPDRERAPAQLRRQVR